MEKNTIDRYITAHLPGGLTPREQAVKAFQDRANKLDADINPLLAYCQRGDEMLKEETVYNDNAEKNLAAGLFRINVYEDKNFKQTTMRSMHELCCTIKTDRDWIEHIQERVAQGLPPLETDGNQAPPGINRQAGQQQNGQRQGPRRRGGNGQGRMRRGPGTGAGAGAQRGLRQRGGMRRGQGQGAQQ